MGAPRKSAAWREYEKAVAAFVQAMDSAAKVTHDARLPDAHTGSPRQRDVWVEGRLCGLFPIRVLISCKRQKAKLDEQDIDHFNGELLSSRANKGVIYSFSGFNDKAVAKAKELGISCMQLVKDAPPPIPDLISFPQAYCCYPRLSASLLWKEDPGSALGTWDDLLSRQSSPGSDDETVAQYLAAEYLKARHRIMDEPEADTALPLNWSFEVTYDNESTPAVRARIRLSLTWDVYQANIDAYIANGTYSLTERAFYGNVTSPSVDTWSAVPGPGWTRIPDRPKNTGGRFVFAFHLTDILRILQTRLSPKDLPTA